MVISLQKDYPERFGKRGGRIVRNPPGAGSSGSYAEGTMVKRVGLFVVVAMLAAGPAAAQDAQAALQAAADTMGVTDMMSIQYSGSGWVGGTGQNFSPDQDWPALRAGGIRAHHRFRDELVEGGDGRPAGRLSRSRRRRRADSGRPGPDAAGPGRARLEHRDRPGGPQAAGRRAASAGDLPHAARVPQGRHGRRSDRDHATGVRRAGDRDLVHRARQVPGQRHHHRGQRHRAGADLDAQSRRRGTCTTRPCTRTIRTSAAG